jgi:hypothetical protein
MRPPEDHGGRRAESAVWRRPGQRPTLFVGRERLQEMDGSGTEPNFNVSTGPFNRQVRVIARQTDLIALTTNANDSTLLDKVSPRVAIKRRINTLIGRFFEH